MAVETGGAQGIGLGIARHLFEEIWRVAALDIDGEVIDEFSMITEKKAL